MYLNQNREKMRSFQKKVPASFHRFGEKTKMNDFGCHSHKSCSRREFVSTIGKTTSGLFFAPYLKLGKIHEKAQFTAQVALTSHNDYTQAVIKQKVQHLFDSIGGIADVAGPGDLVAIKINLTGGSTWAESLAGQGIDIRECAWTHPEVVRAVAELLIDAGVSADHIHLVDALWDEHEECYNHYGYRAVQQALGIQMTNLENKSPYSDFVQLPVPNPYYYTSFKVNRILQDADAYISIPKMKQHASAGVTHSLKNQFGMVPLQFYKTSNAGTREKLHSDGGSYLAHLPRSVSDLNLARPVNLAVIDGIKNAVGGEGPWSTTFEPAEFDVLLAGKDPVATDSVASYLMGNDPEAEKLLCPDGKECDNHLELLHQKGAGTNQMSEIERVGDGAGLVGVRPDYRAVAPDDFQLAQNFPNPFNAQTTIWFAMPRKEYVTIKLYDVAGREIETCVDGFVPSGQHELKLNTRHLASGIYLYRMQAGGFADTKRMILQK
jgi:uncharacterized protein (DUF362 family)